MKNKKECEIVQDLLVSYADGILNPESKKLVEEHIKDCENCQLELKHVQDDSEAKENKEQIELDYLKKIYKSLEKDDRLFALVYYATEEHLWDDIGLQMANPLRIEENYNEIIENKIISEVDLHVSSRTQQIGFKCFPDPLKILLENVIVLFLLGKGVDIFKFEKYIEYNDVLYFIINPSKFDYEKIALDNFNWMNVMRNEEYLKIIIDNGKNIVNKKLKYIIKNEFANEEQTRLYYKYFE